MEHVRRVSQRGEWREKLGKLLRVEPRHLGPIRMHILSGVKPGEIFMMCPVLLQDEEEEEEEELASGGRHAPIDRRGGRHLCLRCFRGRMRRQV